MRDSAAIGTQTPTAIATLLLDDVGAVESDGEDGVDILLVVIEDRTDVIETVVEG